MIVVKAPVALVVAMWAISSKSFSQVVRCEGAGHMGASIDGYPFHGSSLGDTIICFLSFLTILSAGRVEAVSGRPLKTNT